MIFLTIFQNGDVGRSRCPSVWARDEYCFPGHDKTTGATRGESAKASHFVPRLSTQPRDRDWAASNEKVWFGNTIVNFTNAYVYPTRLQFYMNEQKLAEKDGCHASSHHDEPCSLKVVQKLSYHMIQLRYFNIIANFRLTLSFIVYCGYR